MTGDGHQSHQWSCGVVLEHGDLQGAQSQDGARSDSTKKLLRSEGLNQIIKEIGQNKIYLNKNAYSVELSCIFS